jgi:hypothetical protein
VRSRPPVHGRRARLALSVAACMALAASIAVPLRTAHAEPAPAIDFTLPLAEGGHWRLAEQRGREVWLALVAPYCGDCAGFVTAAAGRVQARAGDAAGAPLLMVVSTLDARGAPLALEGDARAALLVDREDAVLRMLDPADLPWLVRIDEDGRAVAAGGDLDALAPVEAGEGMWGNLVSRWRRVWDE